MSKCILNIWGREFELNIVYECYPGEEVLDRQKEATEWLDGGDLFTTVLEYVIQYVMKTAPSKIDSPIENIFKYVMPKSIFVPHSKKSPKLALMCNYKFDPEHGIAIVFENGKYKEIGEQDIIV